MRLLDVNVLVHAHREDAPEHAGIHAWLSELTSGAEPLGVAALALAGFLRIVTHPRVFTPPSPLADALRFVEILRSLPTFVEVAPGPRHFTIFTDLCRKTNAKGNLVPDAYFAALAIEAGCEWITCDRGFGRFSELRWQHPLHH